jgi:zinc transporter
MYESLKLSAGGGADRVGDVTWMDVDVSDEAGTNWLSTQSGLSEEVKSQLLHPGKFSRREMLEDGLLVNICAISPATEGASDDVITLGLLLEQNRVISVRSRKIAAIEEVRSHVNAGTGPRTPLGFLAFAIVCIKKRLEPLITRVAEETADLETSVLGDDVDARVEAVDALRREVFRVRRYVSPFQNLLTLIVSDPTVNASHEERRALDGALELMTRYLHALEDCRERTALLHDLIDGRVSQTMARATYNLTIIATVFLPLTFVTGLLGMNVAGIPEEHSPWGFWIVVGALIVVAVGSWAWLRWEKWLIQT